MIKKIIFTGILLTNTFTGLALADCVNNRVAVSNNLRTLLRGNTICVSNGQGGWESQEEHATSGEIIDYKKGPTDPVDPRKKLGTWSTTAGNDATVTYNYTAFGPTVTAVYRVYLTAGVRGAAGSTYDFCEGGVVKASGTLKLGTGAGC
ncbi:MAG: hypothetical protein HOP34_13880 [Methylococcaceae bacterium]|nr:hypothetical protein [Methylococcaceae bacterium]